MGTKMGPSKANLFVGYRDVKHQFFNKYDGPKPELFGRYIDDCIRAISSGREKLNQFTTSISQFFSSGFKVHLGNFRNSASATNPQILTITCCIRLHIHLMSKIPFPILNFLDFDVYAVMIFLTNHKKCAIFSKNAAILLLLFKRLITALNKLIDSQHYKRHKRNRMTEFHSPSHFTLKITQLKPSF